MRRTVCLLLALLVVVGGCSAPAPADEGEPRRADTVTSVSDDGFRLDLGGLTFRGEPGVAPVGTEVRVESSPELPLWGDDVEVAAGFAITLSGGRQPASPVTVELSLVGQDVEREGLAFITQNSETGEWSGIPVARDGSRARVDLEHFSGGWFLWAGSVLREFSRQASAFYGLSFPAPSCHGQAAVHRGAEITVSVDNDRVYPCVSADDGFLAVSVHSNSPFVWRVRGYPDQVRSSLERPPAGIAQVLTLALYRGLPRTAGESVLVPGGSSTLNLHPDVTQTHVGARVDAHLGLIAVLAAGIQQYLTIAGVSVTALEAAEIGECAAGTIESAPGADPVPVTRTILGCTATFVDAAAAVPLAVMTSLVGLLATQVMGVVGELTSTNEATITVTAATAAASACEERELRSARDESGSQPLAESGTDGYWYDAWTVHTCRGSWALVEASRSSSSVFDFWLLERDDTGWLLRAVGGVSLGDGGSPVFRDDVLSDAGLTPQDVIEALGTRTTGPGRPLTSLG